jgi:hypothetical protein
LVATVPAFAGPAQVIIIRHGEKPPTGDGLSLKGKQRAAALVPYFLGTPEVLEYKTPTAIYAQKSTDEHRSTRPVDTVKWLARKLKLKVIEYDHDDFTKMVKEIMAKREYEGKMVLICWEHKAIKPVAEEFGVKDVKHFPDAFDRTWVISFPKDGAPTLRDLPQKLMFKDSPK